MFKNWKKLYIEVLEENKILKKQINVIDSKMNEVEFNYLDIKNQLAVKNKKLKNSESKIRELYARIGGLTKENNKQRNELKKYEGKYILEKLPSDKTRSHQKTRLKNNDLKIQTKKVLKEKNDTM